MYNGTMIGNLTGISYYMLFQLLGIAIMGRLLSKEKFSVAFQVLIGSVAGTVALQWFPILFAFSQGFSVSAHMLASWLLFLIYFIVYRKTEPSIIFSRHNPYLAKRQWFRFIKENPCILLITFMFVFFFYCLITHSIPISEDGSIHTGQATYGDMNMHLGFITSIANQQAFPPEYSIFPGTKLAYPFICDSVSSTLYLFGTSLQVAYIFPMLGAILQVFCGFYCFIKFWLQKASVAVIAWIMFFLNGGLGFIYFTDAESLSKNFTDFYYTPTSLGDMNIRWAQLIANMLIPQRATLFGWAVLFPLLALLLYAVRNHSTKCFVIAGLLAGALPMIHTHSFMGLGLVCVMWLFYDLCKSTNNESPSALSCRNIRLPLLRYALYIGLLLFSLLQAMNYANSFADKHGIIIMLAGLFVLAVFFLIRLFPIIKMGTWRPLLETWGVFLIIVILLALPQLFFWTFGQANGDGFVRSNFNWSNNGNQYIWFYIKNIGITFLLLLPAYLFARKKDLEIASPFLLIWFIAELVAFQPNEYDNNKLLYVGFIFICGLAANFTVCMFTLKWPKLLKYIVGTTLLFFGTISALLTLGREYVSDYQLYPASGVKACRFIEENTPADAVFLTASNHNNVVASLTGRNIVCGAGTFLYFHGIDYYGREQQLAQMYSNPVGNLELYHTYDVSYIYISGTERWNFQVNEEGIQQIADCIYEQDDVKIYELRE